MLKHKSIISNHIIVHRGSETTSQVSSQSTGVDSTRTSITGQGDPTESNARSTQSSSPSSTASSSQSSPTGIIIGVVVAAAVTAICMAIIWYFCARRRRHVEKQAKGQNHASTPAWNATAGVSAGLHPSPHTVEPFNPYTLSGGSIDPYAIPVVNSGGWGTHNASWHDPQDARHPAYSSDPSTYSGPPNGSHLQHVPVPATNLAPTASAMPYSWHPPPWTSGSSIQTGRDSGQTRMESPSPAKARYSGTNDSKTRYIGGHSAALSSSSSSRPLSPSTITESAFAPPQYEK